jgi:hypothetical protein
LRRSATAISITLKQWAFSDDKDDNMAVGRNCTPRVIVQSKLTERRIWHSV